MIRYALRRLLQFVVVLWAASLIVFIAIYVIGNPVRLMVPIGTSPQLITSMQHQLGLDQPLGVQYLHFLNRIIHLDFGTSLWLGEPALQAVWERIPITGVLVLSATVVGSAIGIVLGLVASIRPGHWLDNAINALSYTFVSIAPFWLGLMLILIVAVKLGFFSTGGFAWDPEHLLLPIATLAVRPVGRVTQITRSLMIAEAGKQYVTTAHAKGLSQAQVSLKHQLRNVSAPVLTVIFYDFAKLLVGDAIVVEVVFSIQGVGGLAVGALENGDINLAQTTVIVAAVIVAFINFSADFIYLQMDPRTRELVRRA